MKKYSRKYNFRRWLLPLSLISALIFFSCGRIPMKNGEMPLARVYDKYLYPNDLAGIFNGINNAADSARLARSFIDQWTKRQLLVRMAEYNLLQDQKNFDAQIQEYRSSLLIYEYEKQLVSEKVDTLISNRQMENYYNDNLDAFLLEAPIIKALYIRIEKSNANIPQIRKLIRSSSDQDFESLIELGQKESDRFDFFNDEWVSFPLIMEKIPGQPEDFDEYLKKNKSLEGEDKDFVHFLLIRDYLVSGEQAPISYIEDRIRGLVLSKRKLDYIRQIEGDLLQDALSSQQIEIYE